MEKKTIVMIRFLISFEISLWDGSSRSGLGAIGGSDTRLTQDGDAVHINVDDNVGDDFSDSHDDDGDDSYDDADND